MSKNNLEQLRINLEDLKNYFRGKVVQNQVRAERTVSESLEILNGSK